MYLISNMATKKKNNEHIIAQARYIIIIWCVGCKVELLESQRNTLFLPFYQTTNT